MNRVHISRDVLYNFTSDLNTLRQRQNGRNFADDTFKRIFVNENARISIKISLKFVAKGPINNIPVLVQIMAWRRPGDKPLSQPMVLFVPTHICVTRPQWVKYNWSILTMGGNVLSVGTIIIATQNKHYISNWAFLILSTSVTGANIDLKIRCEALLDFVGNFECRYPNDKGDTYSVKVRNILAHSTLQSALCLLLPNTDKCQLIRTYNNDQNMVPNKYGTRNWRVRVIITIQTMTAKMQIYSKYDYLHIYTRRIHNP